MPRSSTGHAKGKSRGVEASLCSVKILLIILVIIVRRVIIILIIIIIIMEHNAQLSVASFVFRAKQKAGLNMT